MGVSTRPKTAPSIGGVSTRPPPSHKPGDASTTAGANHGSLAHRRAKNVTEDLNRTLHDGWCEVNLARLQQEDLVQLALKLIKHKDPMVAFKLILSSSGVDTQNELEESLLSDFPYNPSEKKHGVAIQAWKALVETDKMRRAVSQALSSTLSAQRPHLRFLTINFPLTKSWTNNIIQFTAHAQQLEVLNLCGASLGDEGLEQLLPALKASAGTLKKIYLENCGITDAGAHLLGQFIKASTARVAAREWETHLRTYRIRPRAFRNRRPDRDFDAAPVVKRTAAAQAAAAAAAAETALAEGEELPPMVSLSLLDLSWNEITDEGLYELVDAIKLDKGLEILSLRHNRLQGQYEPYPGTVLETEALCRAAVSDTRSSAAVIDLRGNPGGGLGRIVAKGVDITKYYTAISGEDPVAATSDALQKSKARARALGAGAAPRRPKTASLLSDKDGQQRLEEIKRKLGLLPATRPAAKAGRGARGAPAKPEAAAPPADAASKAAAPPPPGVAAVLRELSLNFDLHDRAPTPTADASIVEAGPPPPPEAAPEESLRGMIQDAREELASLKGEAPGSGSGLEGLLGTIEALSDRIALLESTAQKRIKSAKKKAAKAGAKKAGGGGGGARRSIDLMGTGAAALPGPAEQRAQEAAGAPQLQLGKVPSGKSVGERPRDAPIMVL